MKTQGLSHNIFFKPIVAPLVCGMAFKLVPPTTALLFTAVQNLTSRLAKDLHSPSRAGAEGAVLRIATLVVSVFLGASLATYVGYTLTLKQATLLLLVTEGAASYLDSVWVAIIAGVGAATAVVFER